jgi:hypothetical protein
MKYLKITPETDTKITGSPNGVYSVEIKKNSFASDAERKYFEEFQKAKEKQPSTIYYPDFLTIDSNKISEITYFPSFKRAKEIDVIQYCPNQLGFQLMLSEKLYNMISVCRLPKHNAIRCRIDTFSQCYFLLGFPIISSEAIDFEKSFFLDQINHKIMQFPDHIAYNEANYIGFVKEIHLKTNLPYDLINIKGGLFLVESIYTEIQNHKFIGLNALNSFLFLP